MLDKSDPVPLYMQLQRQLREEILSGIYLEGERIPSEAELTKKYQVTRTTVRRAIANLVNEGLLEQVHGKGTYVRFKKVKYSLWNFGGFTEYILKKNETPVSKVLEKKIVDFHGTPYMKLVRARGVKKDHVDLYLTIDTSLLPLKLFPGIDAYDFSKESLYHILRTRYQTNPKRAEIQIIPIESDPLMREIFRMEKNQPLLLAKGHVIDEWDREIEKVRIIYGPDIEMKIMASMS